MGDEKFNPTGILAALIESAEAQFTRALHEELLPERDTKLAQLSQLRGPIPERMAHQFRIHEEFLLRGVRQRIAIYGRVAEENQCPAMLSTQALDTLRARIMRGVTSAIHAVQDRNRQDAWASGDVHPLVLASMNSQVETLKGKLLGAANVSLRVLETAGQVTQSAKSGSSARRANSQRTGKKAHFDKPIEAVKKLIRELKKLSTPQFEICKRLGKSPRPPNAAWRDLDWLAAYRHPKFGKSVKSWLSRVT